MPISHLDRPSGQATLFGQTPPPDGAYSLSLKILGNFFYKVRGFFDILRNNLYYLKIEKIFNQVIFLMKCGQDACIDR
jgi:hypothetical protein